MDLQKTKYMKMKINTNTEADRDTLMTVLFALGFVHGGKEISNLTDYKQQICYDTWPCVLVQSIKNKHLDASKPTYGMSPEYKWPEDATTIIKSFDEITPIVIEGVGDYEATVTRTGIQVGCQTISLEKFQEIADAVAKMKV